MKKDTRVTIQCPSFRRGKKFEGIITGEKTLAALHIAKHGRTYFVKLDGNNKSTQFHESWLAELPAPSTPVKETEPEQPYYKGKGEHSVNQLEAICSQYKEYVSFLNSRGNDTTPTSKEGLEDGGFTKGEWDIAESKETHHTEYAIKSNGWHIAKLNPYAPENIHAEANARLIAAAPAMYKALKEEIECLEEWNGNGNYTTRIEKIKAILTRINKD